MRLLMVLCHSPQPLHPASQMEPLRQLWLVQPPQQKSLSDQLVLNLHVSLPCLCSVNALVQTSHTWYAGLLQSPTQLTAGQQLCPSICSICQPAFVIKFIAPVSRALWPRHAIAAANNHSGGRLLKTALCLPVETSLRGPAGAAAVVFPNIMKSGHLPEFYSDDCLHLLEWLPMADVTFLDCWTNEH